MIGLSLDTDWEDGEVLQDTLDLLKKYKIKATFFCTNKTNTKISGHEIAIHPNFNLKEKPGVIIKKLKKDFPQAKGLRSHGIATSNQIISEIEKEKVKYQSNYMMYLKKNIEQIEIYNIEELPIYWMDYYYLMIEKNPKFELSELKLKEPGLKIFDFHPVHIYLNTRNLADYFAYKKNKKHPQKYINKNQAGIQTLFVQALKYLKSQKIQDATLVKIVKNYV